MADPNEFCAEGTPKFCNDGLVGRMARGGETSVLVGESTLVSDASLSWPPSLQKFIGSLWFSLLWHKYDH